MQRNGYLERTGILRREEASGRFMSIVYRWMTIGVAITAVISWMLAQSPEVVYGIATNKLLFYGLIIGELGLVFWLSARVEHMTAVKAITLFLLYAILNGVTLSTISLVYTAASIQSAFLTATCGFAGLSFFGYVTKRDLGPVGTFCHMGLWGIIGFALISLFFPSMMGGTLGTVYGVVGIIVFAGLSAYDTQKIKSMYIHFDQGSVAEQKAAVMGALKLYLDFINLFLFILRFMGRGRD